MDAFHYTMLLPPLIAAGLAPFVLRRDRAVGLSAFLGVAVMLTIPLEFVWFSAFVAYSIWLDPGRLDLWLLFAFLCSLGSLVAYWIWKERH